MHLHYIYLDLRRADVANSLSFEELSPQKKSHPTPENIIAGPEKGGWDVEIKNNLQSWQEYTKRHN